MTWTVYVTEQIVSAYHFDTEDEARTALDSGDMYATDADIVDGEVLDVEIIEQKGY